ncbi:MAG: hypothetical protein [Wendovervirus sonii]|uniref:Uncharacterized protein n=1 Tax=phage Lak_Megaphage_Sonny TaxID=3109229 RepID=A0ABZ0Z5L7_9CAUD|nr:MAG: hypothetical protein [phage Lak_Megaphage_Sonny]
MTFKELINIANINKALEYLVTVYPEEKNKADIYKEIFKTLNSLKGTSAKYKIRVRMSGTGKFRHYIVVGVDKEGKAIYALDLMPWSEWVSMEIDDCTFESISDINEILAACLYEMTFFGFSENDIENYKEKLNKIIEDINENKA